MPNVSIIMGVYNCKNYNLLRKSVESIHALNECLAVSQGKYIARQDDDDVSKPERLKKQVQFLYENREYAIVGTCADVF